MPKMIQPALFAEEAITLDGLTQRHACYLLFALQHWEAIKQPLDGPYGPGLFYKQRASILHGLTNVGRRTVLSHLAKPVCLGCDTPVSLHNSVLDHIMPKAAGGPDDLQNTLVLCRRCNSSKGAKDLLVWWVFRGREACALPRNILCLYARVYWQYAGEDWHTAPCSVDLLAFLMARMQALPSSAHQTALLGSMHAFMAEWHASHIREGA